MTSLRLTFRDKHYTLRYILNYLRHGELLCPDDKILRNELLNEASFYQVQGIICQLTKSLITLSKIIMENSQAFTVMSWLPSVASCTLIFRASNDGKTAPDFHRCCDNKGPTLIVIQSGEFIFGGYTSKSWTSRKCLIKYILVLRWKVYFIELNLTISCMASIFLFSIFIVIIIAIIIIIIAIRWSMSSLPPPSSSSSSLSTVKAS